MYTGPFGRRDRLVLDERRDVYLNVKKLPDSTVCERCGAVFTEGRWTWTRTPNPSGTTLCPACQRVQDRIPAGIVDIRGTFFDDHRHEMLGLVRNVASLEKGEHPLERVISIRERRGLVRILTTGIHIARRIGDALSRSYQGTLSLDYADDEKGLLVTWER